MLSTLSTSLSGITDLSTINTRTATAGTSSVLSATASSAAQTGTYNVNVKALASVQEIYSSTKATGSASAAAKLASSAGTLTFTLQGGKTETVTVGSGSMTLNGIASAINKVAGGVKAGVVSTAKGAELTLQSSATGSSQAFNVSGTGTVLSKFDYTNPTSASAATTSWTSGSMTRAQRAGNSSLTMNGVPITATSNKISSAMTGVSLTLNGKGSSTLNISSSTTGVSSAVGKVATNLNAAISAIAKQTYWASSAPTTASSFIGIQHDAKIRRARGQLHRREHFHPAALGCFRRRGQRHDVEHDRPDGEQQGRGGAEQHDLRLGLRQEPDRGAESDRARSIPA